MHLWPVYRVQAGLAEAYEIAAAFLTGKEWDVVPRQASADHIVLFATKPARSPFSFAPQRVVWNLHAAADSSIIQCQYHLGKFVLAVLNVLLVASTGCLYFGVLKDGHPLLSIFSLVTSLVLLFCWIENRSVETLATEFRITAHNDTGIPTIQESTAFGSSSSLPWLIAHEIAFFGLFAAIMPHIAVVLFVTPELVALAMLLVLLVMVAARAGNRLTKRLYYCGEYFYAAIIVVAYCCWPPIADTMFTGGAAILLVALFIVIPFCLWRLGRLAGRQETLAAYELPMTFAAKDRWISRAMTTIALLSWFLLLAAQVHALSAARHLISRATPGMLVLTISWALPLIVAYITLVVHMSRQATDSPPTPAPLAVIARCHELAVRFQIRLPQVVLTDRTTSHVTSSVFARPTIALATGQLARLGEDERDALLLHELYHVRHHTRVVAVLEGLSRITLCGRGLLTILIDPWQFELDADKAAADALDCLGRPGKKITQRMLGAIEGHLPHPPVQPLQSRIARLTNLFFGDGPSWSYHPTLPERTHALARSTTCRT